MTHISINEASFSTRFRWLDATTRPYYINYSCYKVNAFRVQVKNGLQNVFFVHFSLVSIQFDMIAVVHAGGYAVIQVKHWRDINLKLSVYF